MDESMKRRISLLIALLLVIVVGSSVVLVACDNKDDLGSQVSSEYVIQYTDDDGTHQITVKSGDVYSIENIPTRNGYDFVGLFDAETGGTQYVNAQGASLAPFTDNKNLVLFPRFNAKEYILALDYQGAAVTGEREIAVSYGSRISNLPTNLVLDNKEFMGWYTEPNRGGLQVADQYGVIPTNSVVSSDNFDLTDLNGFIRLYAGFRGEMHTITFYFEDGIAPEEIEVEHGTPISDVVTETRVENKAVLTWSKKPNDTSRSDVFSGRVESNMTLYALDYAPVIDFDADGGKEVSSIVASAGSAITLPTAQRDNYQFAGWYTTGGVKYMATTMPTDSVKLKAKWTPMLIFDERGGTLVDDIAAEQGTKVTLPTTEKDGYMFAGWYTEQGEVYTATAMPEFSTKLVAKYWRVEKEIIVIANESTVITVDDTTKPTVDIGFYKIDLTSIHQQGVKKIHVRTTYKARYYNASSSGSLSSSRPSYTNMAWYSANIVNSAYKIWEYSDSHTSSMIWNTFTHETTLNIDSDSVYLALYHTNNTGHYRSGGNWTDFWIEVEYPDMSQLY